MGTVPTVKVKVPHTKGGFVVINESDFDPEKHELYEEPSAPVAPAAEVAPEAETDDAGEGESAFDDDDEE